MKKKIEKKIEKKYKINRHYMIIQTFGQDGGYHIDDSDINAFTFCLYINELTDTEINEINGEFLIKIPYEKKILSIDTYMNRGIFFPSNYLHKGMAYNKMYANERLCITWKLQLII